MTIFVRILSNRLYLRRRYAEYKSLINPISSALDHRQSHASQRRELYLVESSKQGQLRVRARLSHEVRPLRDGKTEVNVVRQVHGPAKADSINYKSLLSVLMWS